MNYEVYIANDDRNPRRRARRVSIPDIARHAAERAAELGREVITARHGGDVCNSYGYPAATDAVVAVALERDGVMRVVVWATEIPANKVTLRGVAAATVGHGAIFDGRVNDETKAAARKAIITIAEAVIAHEAMGV